MVPDPSGDTGLVLRSFVANDQNYYDLTDLVAAWQHPRRRSNIYAGMARRSSGNRAWPTNWCRPLFRYQSPVDFCASMCRTFYRLLYASFCRTPMSPSTQILTWFSGLCVVLPSTNRLRKWRHYCIVAKLSLQIVNKCVITIHISQVSFLLSVQCTACITLDRIWIHFSVSVGCPYIRRQRPRLWAHFWTDLHQIWNSWLSLTSRRKYFLGSPWNGRGEDHVTIFLILYTLTYSGTVNDGPFKFYIELRTEEHNNFFYV